jgi:hypothetical protein
MRSLRTLEGRVSDLEATHGPKVVSTLADFVCHMAKHPEETCILSDQMAKAFDDFMKV